MRETGLEAGDAADGFTGALDALLSEWAVTIIGPTEGITFTGGTMTKQDEAHARRLAEVEVEGRIPTPSVP